MGYDDYQYHITQALLDVGPSTDAHVHSRSVVSLGHRHFPGDTFVATTSNQAVHKSSDPVETISELGQDAYAMQGDETIVYHHGDEPDANTECVAYAYLPDQTSIPQEGGVSWSKVIVPGGCLVVPPAEDWCKITTPELILDHGTIALTNAEGDSATTNMNVNCVAQTDVKFNLISNENYIYLDENGVNDGQSTITVDNQDLNTKIVLPSGDSSHQIKDYLTGVTEAGAHVGSSVLVMELY